MSSLRCKKHDIDLECMGGCSAHRDNWYCPKCDAEEVIRKEYEAARKEEYKKEFNAYCATVMGYTLTGAEGIGNIKPTYTDSAGLHQVFVENYNPYETFEQRLEVVDVLNARGEVGPADELIDEVGTAVAQVLFIMETKPSKINFAEEGDYLIFDHEPPLSEESMKELKDLYEEKLINAYCASVMEYHERPGNNNEPLYYDEDGFYIGLVKDYKPYDDLQQLYVIAAELTKQLNVSVGFREEEEKGALVAYRDFILSTIMTEDDIKELDVYTDEETITVDADEHDFKSMGGDPTNINWQAGRILVLANYRGFASFYSGCTDEYFLSKEPNSSNCIESIEIDSFNDNGLSQSNAIEGYIRDPANGLGLWETAEGAIDTMGTTIRTTTTVQAQRTGIIRKCLEIMAAEHMSEQDKFNDRCRRIVSAYGEPCTFVDEYNPYDNMNSLVEVIEIIIKKVEIDFLVNTDSSVNFTKEMRAFVKWYGSEEYINLD